MVYVTVATTKVMLDLNVSISDYPIALTFISVNFRE